jgi:hypothetical protein
MKLKSFKNWMLIPLLGGGVVLCAPAVFAEDAFDQGDENGYELPDFTKVYGFDARPDVNFVKNKRKESRLQKWKRKLKQSASRESGNNKMGVQKYTQHSGKRKYGVGLTRNKDEVRSVGVTVHGHGVSYNIKNKKSRREFLMGVDARTKEPNVEKDGAHMYFGIKTTW